MAERSLRVPVIEYVLPNGRRRDMTIMIDRDLESQWQFIHHDMGLRCEFEKLRNGVCSVALTDLELGDFDSRLCRDDSEAWSTNLEDMIQKFSGHTYLQWCRMMDSEPFDD